MDELLQDFIAETRETLAAIAGEIVAWEAAPDDRARLDAIFRFVHTVKGSCGFLDLPRLARLSHAAEDVLAAVRSGERRPDTRMVDAVLAIIDRIGGIVEAIDAGTSLDDTGDDLLIAALDGEGPMPAPLPEERPPPAGTPAPARAATRSVRLSVDLLDRMMSGMSDMVLARNELARKLRDDADPRLEAALERLSASVAEMRETVTRTRMQTIDALFSPLPRMVRDTAASLGKTVSLTILGADVELDREMVEVMRDPLVHLIRNAIDHGLEAAADRRRAGKPDTGHLTVSARQAGNQIIIDIADDGRGIDAERLVAKLSAQPGQDGAMLRALPETAKLELVFHPGLSSKDEATAISGRGVGMDVVRANVEQVGGRIELCNTPGRGLVVSIHVPLTLSIIPAVIVGVSGQRFALPRQSIREIVTIGGDAVRVQRLGDADIATVRDRRMPLVDLGVALGMSARERSMIVILELRDGSYALSVDDVFDTEELVVKPATPAVMSAGVYAGQTLPDSGLPMLLLDAAGIADRARLVFTPEPAADVTEATAVRLVEALLFVDLGGERRAIPLHMVDRIQQVPVASMHVSAGRLRMTVDGGTVPLIANAPIVNAALGGGSMRPVLRMHDDRSELGYVIGEAVDIVALPAAIAAAASPGLIAGVAVIDGEQIEVIDPFWLFAQGPALPAPVSSPASVAPLCLLQPDAGGWLDGFLRPMLEGASYRVATSPAGAEPADIVLAFDDGATWLPPAGAPLVTLTRDPGDRTAGHVYRYDRAGVLAAIARKLGTAA